MAAVVLACLAVWPACAKRIPLPDATRVIEMREGLASWYGERFHGRMMASGGRFDMHEMVAAHPSYPFGTLVRITNLANRRQVRVRILDRGPAAGPRADGVIIDLSHAAADVRVVAHSTPVRASRMAPDSSGTARVASRHAPSSEPRSPRAIAQGAKR